MNKTVPAIKGFMEATDMKTDHLLVYGMSSH